MFPESFHHEYESEISDNAFNEVFEEGIQEYINDSSNNYPSDNIFYDTINSTDINSDIESLALQIEGLEPQEAYDHISEAFPALIPIIAKLAPAVISAVTTLAPMAVKAVGGFVGKMSKSKKHKPHRNPVVRRTSPRPRPQHRHPNCSCNNSNAGISKLGQSALGSLANLLSNKNVQNVLSNLANKGVSQALKLGNSEIIAREGELLNAISYLAREAQYEVPADQYLDTLSYPETTYDNFDNEHSDHDDSHTSDEAAMRFIELFNS